MRPSLKFLRVLRRPVRIAACVLASALLAGGPVLAQGRHEGWGRGNGNGWGHGGWNGGPHGEGGGNWGYGPGPQGREGWGGRGGYGAPRGYGPPPRSYAPPPRTYPPPQAYAPYPGMPTYPRRLPPAGYGIRRGGLIPPEYRSAIVPDYSRHRLRPPPPGFAWVRMGDRYMLVSRATGQIFDVIGR